MPTFNLTTASIATTLILLFATACNTSNKDSDQSNYESKWRVVWEDNFDNGQITDSTWTRIPRGTPQWAKTMAPFNDECFGRTDTSIILRGIVNTSFPDDESKYHTGGIWSRDKKCFSPPGRIEVRARITAANGAWPAIWLMPYETPYTYPDCGEIDIMERLNHEKQVYQTVHSGYTQLNPGEPVYSSTTEVADPENFHVYGVDILADKIVFHIDGKETHSYPKINNGANDQYPYYKNWALYIDMQLGGQWVGTVNTDELPVEMEIDWVRHSKNF